MSSNIYNEGRVVGYSAYEIYVRHVLSEDPNHTPASELEWLSSSIAMGSSMLLKISAESASVSGHHALKIILPNATNLVAANTIIGSLFLGDAEFDNSGWATKVTSYGPLLDNNSLYLGTHPNTMNESPLNPQNPLSSTYQDRILNYIKLVDGIVIQPGEWKNSTDTFMPPATYPNPKHDLFPDFDYPDNGSVPYVRLYLSDRVTEDFYILLTGFTINGVINGVSGLDGSTDTTTNMHENGGFLGPAVFPWANKIIFSVPPAYANYFLDARYSRALQNKRTSTSPESFGTSEDVRAVSVIDMESGNPNSYYQSMGSAYIRYDLLTSEPADWSTAYTRYYEKNQNDEYVPISGSSAPTWAQDTYYQKVSPCIGVEVTDCNKTTGDSILTVYQRNDILPPALYASKVSATGEYELNPVDTIAPGTVKLYENDTNGVKAKALEDEIPGNYALMRDTSDYVVKELDDNQNTIPVAETSIVDSSSDSTLAAVLAKSVQNITGKKTSKSLSMTDANGNAYSVQEPAIDPSDPTATTISPTSGNIHWETLLKALAGNKSIDIFSTTRFLDEFYRAARARLLAGRGIGFTPNDTDSELTIAANLTAGSGISIEDPVGDNSKKIAAKFAAGPGVSLMTLNDGSVQITNTAMYPGAIAGYSLIDPNNYTATFYGSFRSVKGDVTHTQQEVQNAYTTPHINVYLFPMFNSDGTLAQCYFRIDGAGWSDDQPPVRCHIGNYSFDSTNFQFGHGSNIYSQPLQRVLSIRFKDHVWNISGNSFNLQDLHTMSFAADAATGDIWNIKGMNRGSYTVVCNLENVNPNTQGAATNKQIVLSAKSIADGFNQQYSQLAYTEGKSDSELYSEWLNLNMSGIFY